MNELLRGTLHLRDFNYRVTIAERQRMRLRALQFALFQTAVRLQIKNIENPWNVEVSRLGSLAEGLRDEYSKRLQI